MTNAYYLNQFISTTLSTAGGIDDSQTTGIKITSTSGVTTDKPGILCLSYSDPIDITKAEWISYTSIDVFNELQGVTRGEEGFSAKAHSNGVTVAFPISRSHINNLNDALIIGGVATNLVEGVIDDDTMATASATNVPTSESVKNFVGAGWIPVSETWTRTGNHTFTVATDLTAKYRKGTKVRYKDGGAYEYGTVISSSYSSPNTTVTLASNTDYAMAAATITNTYISYIDNPEGFPQKFNFTIALTLKSGSGTLPTFSSSGATFVSKGRLFFVTFSLTNSSGGTAGSGSGQVKLSFPFDTPDNGSIDSGMASLQNGETFSNLLIWPDGSLRKSSFVNALCSDFSDADIRYLKGFITITI